MKKLWLILEFWLWGAMHSPHFHLFIIELDHFPVEITFHWSKWTRELFMIQVFFYIPKLCMNAPHAAETEFLDAMTKEGRQVSLDLLDSIPF